MRIKVPPGVANARKGIQSALHSYVTVLWPLFPYYGGFVVNDLPLRAARVVS